ncbi:MAG: helix-turn-helix transcriptional regulator [Actinomycetota bacterium]|nr:helix-turn-helix transcriptional regulator [Actinomycetota bacterium]MDA8354913.1 helix-turn-helix transcriptional regulator [Actinomycetota bacterium]
MDVPTLIVAAVETAGCSRAELARRAGIPQSVLSAYEHRRREPSVAALTRILSAAGLVLSVAQVGAE